MTQVETLELILSLINQARGAILFNAAYLIPATAAAQYCQIALSKAGGSTTWSGPIQQGVDYHITTLNEFIVLVQFNLKITIGGCNTPGALPFLNEALTLVTGLIS